MSEYWDIRCETCELDMYTSLKNGDHALRVLWDNRVALILIYQQSFNRIRVLADMEHIDMEWLATHNDHDVRVVSEHGYYDDDCGKLDTCSCGCRVWCRLKQNHDGPHGCIHLANGTRPHADANNGALLPPSR